MDFNSPYRTSSRPCSRYASASRRFVKNVQPISCENHDHYTEDFSKSKGKFEVILCTAEMTNAITATGWFHILYNRSQNETD